MGIADIDLEIKPQKKPYTPITPTVHIGFSFSIIHLRSAIRLAMISPLPEDSLENVKSNGEQNGKVEGDTNGLLYIAWVLEGIISPFPPLGGYFHP
uniref:Uncharacterized protein n=1 Tax=Manihot esculenta TaxID=3983 RepID=A0A2C9UYR8_MANES